MASVNIRIEFLTKKMLIKIYRCFCLNIAFTVYIILLSSGFECWVWFILSSIISTIILSLVVWHTLLGLSFLAVVCEYPNEMNKKIGSTKDKLFINRNIFLTLVTYIHTVYTTHRMKKKMELGDTEKAINRKVLFYWPKMQLGGKKGNENNGIV